MTLLTSCRERWIAIGEQGAQKVQLRGTHHCDNQGQKQVSYPSLDFDLVYTSTITFSSLLCLLYCFECLAPNQIPFRIIKLKVFLSSPPLPAHPLTSLLSVLSSKYRHRRLILHLSISHAHANSQVYAGLMQHFACAGKK